MASDQRTYVTVTGEDMFLAGPAHAMTAAERRQATIAEMRAEADRLDAEWHETAEQLLTLQRRRRGIADRRRSLTRTLSQIDALNPFSTKESH